MFNLLYCGLNPKEFSKFSVLLLKRLLFLKIFLFSVIVQRILKIELSFELVGKFSWFDGLNKISWSK